MKINFKGKKNEDKEICIQKKITENVVMANNNNI